MTEPAVAEASHGFPSLPYVSLRKRKNQPPKKRFALRLFTAYTHPQQDYVTARKGNAHPFARYFGPNRSFHEWRITRRTRAGGGRLIRKLRRRLANNRNVAFRGYVHPPGATGPLTFKCKLRGFNNLGGCQGVIVAQ